MKIVNGDLIKLALNGEFDVIIHGCNCFNTMGAGIAKQIKNQFPEAYAVDCTTLKGDKNKLGTITIANIERNNIKFDIVNGYTQYSFGYSTANYNAIRLVMQRVKYLYSGKRIGYPLIGAGLAGGDWNIISSIINNELQDEDHTCVKYN